MGLWSRSKQSAHATYREDQLIETFDLKPMEQSQPAPAI